MNEHSNLLVSEQKYLVIKQDACKKVVIEKFDDLDKAMNCADIEESRSVCFCFIVERVHK